MELLLVLAFNDFGFVRYEQYVPCSEDPCPVDCQYSEWTGLSKCDQWCGPGTNIKTRDVLAEPLHGGVVCDRSFDNLVRNSCFAECEGESSTSFSVLVPFRW